MRPNQYLTQRWHVHPKPIKTIFLIRTARKCYKIFELNNESDKFQ